MKRKIIAPLAAAAIAFSTPFAAFAAEKVEKKREASMQAGDKKAGTADDEKKIEGTKKVMFRGKVASVDAAAKTFTTKNKDGKENVFVVTSSTKIEKEDGTPGTIDDIKVDEPVRGSRIVQADGKMEAVKVKLGMKEGAGKEKGEGKAGAGSEEKKASE